MYVNYSRYALNILENADRMLPPLTESSSESSSSSSSSDSDRSLSLDDQDDISAPPEKRGNGNSVLCM